MKQNPRTVWARGQKKWKAKRKKKRGGGKQRLKGKTCSRGEGSKKASGTNGNEWGGGGPC